MTNANALPIQERLRKAAHTFQGFADEQARFDARPAVNLPESEPIDLPLAEAADRIDALEKALRRIESHYVDTGLAAMHMAAIARPALGEGE